MLHIEHEPIKMVRDGLCFTWDDEKERVNIEKHGISFALATIVFFDESAVVSFNSFDRRTGEERYDVTGIPLPKTLFVVYAERVTVSKRDVIRIISARRANRKERKRYVTGIK